MNDASNTCTEGDCDLSTPNLVASSMSRLFSGDFSSLNEDFLVALLFLGLCILSWQLVYFMLGRFNNKTPGCPPSGRFQYRSRRRPEGGAAMREQHHRVEAPGGAEEHRETDIRAAGDSWDQDEFDPDYDANNEIMVMLLQENPDEENSDDGGNASPHDFEEDGGVLHRIIMARSDDEARILALDDDVTPPSASEQNQANTAETNTSSDVANPQRSTDRTDM